MTTFQTVNMFYIGNFADMDTDETDADTENPDLVLGTHDNLEILPITEVDVDNDGVIYDDEFGTGDYLSYDTGGGRTNVALDSSSLYNADILLGDGSTMQVPVLVLQTGNGDVFISEHPNFPLDDLAIQSISLVSVNNNNAAGINRGASNVENSSVVCFREGTLIATSKGDIPVEDLAAGDLVVTLDNGLQPIRWTHRDVCPLDAVEDDAKPVLIGTGALGKDLPSKDLVISPQHRVFVGGGGQLERLFPSESLAPSKSLTTLRGIRHLRDKDTVTWVHFACDKHEIVTANGCLSESLLLGPMVVNGLTGPERQELSDMYGAAATPEAALNGPTARQCLKPGAVRKHLEDSTSEENQSRATNVAELDIDQDADRTEPKRPERSVTSRERYPLRSASLSV